MTTLAGEGAGKGSEGVSGEGKVGGEGEGKGKREGEGEGGASDAAADGRKARASLVTT